MSLDVLNLLFLLKRIHFVTGKENFAPKSPKTWLSPFSM